MHSSLEHIPYGITAGPSGTEEIPALCETFRSKAVLTTVYPWSLSWRSCILPSTYTLFLFMTHI